MNQKYHVFLSYRRRDEQNGKWMSRVRDDLRRRGLIVWTDEFLSVGTPTWSREIDKAIRSSHCLVVLMSPSALRSRYVQQEIALARNTKKRVLFFLIRTNLLPEDEKEQTIYIDQPLTSPPCIRITTASQYEKAIKDLHDTLANLKISPVLRRDRQVEENISDVFITYRPSNLHEANLISSFLSEAGLRVGAAPPEYLNTLHTDYLDRPLWHEIIIKWIHSANALIVVLSPETLKSRWFKEEITTALEAGKAIYPISVVEDLGDVAHFGIHDYQTKTLLLPSDSMSVEEQQRMQDRNAEVLHDLLGAICTHLALNHYEIINQSRARINNIKQYRTALNYVHPINPIGWWLLLWRLGINPNAYIAYQERYSYESSAFWLTNTMICLIFFIPLFSVWLTLSPYSNTAPSLLQNVSLWVLPIMFWFALLLMWRRGRKHPFTKGVDEIVPFLWGLVLSTIVTLTVSRPIVFFLLALPPVATMKGVLRVTGTRLITRILSSFLWGVGLIFTVLLSISLRDLFATKGILDISVTAAFVIWIVLLSIIGAGVIDLYPFFTYEKLSINSSRGRSSTVPIQTHIILVPLCCIGGSIFLFMLGGMESAFPFLDRVLEGILNWIIDTYRLNGG